VWVSNRCSGRSVAKAAQAAERERDDLIDQAVRFSARSLYGVLDQDLGGSWHKARSGWVASAYRASAAAWHFADASSA
jgi:hypothetical protein